VGDPYRAAYADLRTAESALAVRDRRAARAALVSATATADRLGADSLQREVRLLAIDAHLALDRQEETAPEPGPARRLGLTQREALPNVV